MFGNSIQSFFSDTPNWNYGAVLALWLVVVVLVILLSSSAATSAPTSQDAATGHGDRSAGPARTRACSSYFTLLVLFLYAPLVVLVIFAFNDSDDPDAAVSRLHHQVVPHRLLATPTSRRRSSAAR